MQANPHGDGILPPLRALELRLAEVQAEFDRLRMTDPRRGRLARRIRDLEIAIDHHDPGAAPHA